MKAAAVVITHNGESSVRDTIDTLLKNKNCQKIFVFDNASSDGTLNIVESIKSEKIFLIKNTENIGLGKAINFVIKKYVINNFDWVLLSDQDTHFIDGAFDKLLKFACKLHVDNNNLGAVCGISRNRKYHNFIYSPYIWNGCEFFEIDVSERCDEFIKIGSNIMSGTVYNVKAIEITGYFNEYYFVDFIDHEFNYRMTKQFDFFLLNETLIYHDLGKRIVKIDNVFFHEHNPERYYYMARNMMNFYLNEKNLNFFGNILKHHDLQMKKFSENYENYCIYRNKGIYDGLVSIF